MQPHELVTQLREMRKAEEPIELLVEVLRVAGISKVMSIKVLAELGIPLGQAKHAVHTSATWADVREADDTFSDRLMAALEDLANDDHQGSSNRGNRNR